MTGQDKAYKERVAHMLADEIAEAYPRVADQVATIADTIKTSAEVSLKIHRRWTVEEESLARSAFEGAFGKAPTFGGGFDEPVSLAQERRAFENAAIEAALDYKDVISGMDAAARDHAAGKITIEEFIARSGHAHTDSISARMDADVDRNRKVFTAFVMMAAVLVVIWWIIVLAASLSILVGGVVSVGILGGCTFAYFTFNPYDHR